MIQAEIDVTARIETALDAGQAILEPAAMASPRAAHPEFDTWIGRW